MTMTFCLPNKIGSALVMAAVLLALAGCRPVGMRESIVLHTPTVSMPREHQDLTGKPAIRPSSGESPIPIEAEAEIRQVAFETDSVESNRIRNAAPAFNPDPVSGEVLADQAADEMSFDYSSSASPSEAPWTVNSELPTAFWDLSLDEAIRIGLQNSKVLRGLGGQQTQVLNNPESATTVFEPGLQYSDPQFGAEAALSQFDAQLSSNATYSKNDDVFNNPFTGGGLFSAVPVEVERENFDWNVQLTKTAANGAQFSLTRALHHDYQNPQLANFFVGSWSNYIEGSIRQPLLQGRGVMFNRIAGPNGQPGFRFSNGVIIAQINDKLSEAEFEQGVQAYVEQIISAYWNLYLSYRIYSAALPSYEKSCETWRIIEAKTDLPEGAAGPEARAREQMLMFAQEKLDALHKIYEAEANTRALLGLPIRDSRFIKPSDDPVQTKIVYDWDHLSSLATENRRELQQTRLRVKQRELQLLASKNFLLPRLDAVATYRHYGFGDHLFNGPSASDRFSSALKDYYNGDHHQMQVGLQLNVPLGYRRQFAGLRNAELNLQRERAILDEQQLEVQFEIGRVARELDLHYRTMRVNYNRLVAADQAARVAFERYRAGDENDRFLAEVLDTQLRRARAESDYYGAMVLYEQAQVQIHNKSGVLLKQFGVQFARETSANR